MSKTNVVTGTLRCVVVVGGGIIPNSGSDGAGRWGSFCFLSVPHHLPISPCPSLSLSHHRCSPSSRVLPILVVLVMERCSITHHCSDWTQAHTGDSARIADRDRSAPHADAVEVP